MESTSAIEKLANDLITSLQRVEQRRQQWQTVTKPLVLATLNEIAEKIKLNWSVNVNDMLINLESVFIAFNPMPTGIVEKSEINLVNKMRVGGFLSFSQTRTGQVVVWVSMPLLEGLEEGPARNFTLETLDPEHVDATIVHQYMEKFLEEIIEWENESRDEIGFARHIGA
ncbi:hypothetical protein LX64_03727 [Chitinophaga skermanii]|uniref:Uncharacterized protein n=1 Tax=Chitinophaga skermanii TaxID=331697 RepID=A0A327QCZ7_9BACT|nr:hypothetical protein [Chitinophaga skermanii]RAJ01512.1 hypothetical protein LX64_03727 [Chitinophaga skermanii]